ncbi:MAG: YbaB/EbfC family nucleoid-associated protein [Patescibacteria group bacterium]|nr:YbaB/EbfC family nucleoid-associated protein [Patescibacteria group bacterium]
MFNKLKQIKDLRDQAKTMQSALSKEVFTEEKNGVKITINGNMEISEVSLNENLSKSAQESAIKDAVNDAIKKAQKVMAKKLQDMGGLDGLMK